MDERLQQLQQEIRRLEKDISVEIEKSASQFKYKVVNGVAVFEDTTRRIHRKLRTGLIAYVIHSSPMVALTSPFIYMMLLPALLLDAFVTVYQAICFPVYGIPKISRSDYIIVDRHRLQYLNGLEKFNCTYCGYFNGLMGYVTEIAARTERHWCPIRHARQGRSRNSQSGAFVGYGDAEGYRARLEDIRRRFNT